MRTFIAVDVSSEVLSEIENFVSLSKDRLPKARWVATENLHLTLRFLGEASGPVLGDLSEAIASAARCYAPFSLEFRGIGFFPSSDRPRVLWIGVCDPPDTIMDLQKKIESIARASGFEPESRGFSPHLTLARYPKPVGRDPRFLHLAEKWGQHFFGASRVDDVVLYRSILRPEGAQYHALARFHLG